VVAPGQKSTLDFTPAQAGTFQMTCGMNMFGPGYVIVTQ
jgi:plastocyanin domain-containing protein